MRKVVGITVLEMDSLGRATGPGTVAGAEPETDCPFGPVPAAEATLLTTPASTSAWVTV